MRWLRIAVVVVFVAATTVVLAPSAEATVSGEDGRIAFVSDVSGVDQIYLFDRHGSGVRQITAFGDDGTEAQWIGPLSWSPDGRSLAFSAYPSGDYMASGIWTIAADGTDLRYVTDGRSPSWSPDGRSLAFSTRSVGVVNGLDTSVIAAVDLATGDQVILTDPGTWVNPYRDITTRDFLPQWAPDGREILFARYIPGSASYHSTGLGVVDVDTLTVRGAGTVVGRSVGRIDTAPGGGTARVLIVYDLTGENRSVSVYDMDLAVVGELPPPEGYESVEALYSPSGERLIVYRKAAESGYEMWTTRLDGSDPIKVTDAGHSPAWQPVNPYPMGLVDPATGEWHLRDATGAVESFYYGNPGDFPFMGDWDCDGIDTPGLYRQSDGYVYLRNSNAQGIADTSFYFGDPGDVPIAGDFNADGCDTVSIYRPSEQRFYIINQLGTNNSGLGAADYSFVFGNPGDTPFVGDFNGNGQDTIGLHRASTGLVYMRNTNTTGIAHHRFYFGDPGDRFVTNDWNTDGIDTPAVYRPDNTTHYFRFTNTQGNANAHYIWGDPDWLPITGTYN
jgi:hypothetical protein